MTTITRNPDGTLLIDGKAAALRGGNYDLFFAPKSCPKSLAHAGTTDPIVVPYNENERPCQKRENMRQRAHFVSWAERDNFASFFEAMKNSRCNFVRVYLSLATRRNRDGLLNVVPYNTALDGDRVVYDVKGAVEGVWNDDYFRRLRAFVGKADGEGVVVQLSLFNYFDIAPDEGTTYRSDFAQFAASPWNAANCMNKRWGADHLIRPKEGDPPVAVNPQVQFTSTRSNADKLWPVQNAYIGRVMSAVAGNSNVVIEIMNEPHAVFNLQDLERVARFNSAMTEIIKTHRGGLKSHALISVNATYQIRGGQPAGRSDMELWRAKREEIANFDDVDIVSYHALTALPSPSVPCCDGSANVERVDREAIDDRATKHDDGGLGGKSLVYSTDAVLSAPFKHVYPEDPLLMHLRDGQIICKPPLNPTRNQELTQTYVKHWAFKCLKKNAGGLKGKYHFQNHSSFEAGLVKVGEAAADAGL